MIRSKESCSIHTWSWRVFASCGHTFRVALFQQIQANKCDEATKAGGFGGAVTEFRSWVMHTEDGIIKQVIANF